MPPGAFFYVAPHMVSATESVQILPLRVPLALYLLGQPRLSKKISRGANMGASTGPYFRPSFLVRIAVKPYPAHYPVAVAHATAEHRAYLE